MFKITFDVCQYFETGRDFGFGNNPNGYSHRSYLTNTQCHAQENGKTCKRRGRCVIAREKFNNKQITNESWKNEKPQYVKN